MMNWFVFAMAPVYWSKFIKIWMPSQMFACSDYFKVTVYLRGVKNILIIPLLPEQNTLNHFASLEFFVVLPSALIHNHWYAWSPYSSPTVSIRVNEKDNSSNTRWQIAVSMLKNSKLIVAFDCQGSICYSCRWLTNSLRNLGSVCFRVNGKLRQFVCTFSYYISIIPLFLAG